MQQEPHIYFIQAIYRGPYKNVHHVHVLLNLLNELGKRDKMRSLLTTPMSLWDTEGLKSKR